MLLHRLKKGSWVGSEPGGFRFYPFLHFVDTVSIIIYTVGFRIWYTMDTLSIAIGLCTIAIGLCTLVALILGLYFAGIQLRYMRKERHLDLVMNLMVIWESRAMILSRADIIKNKSGFAQLMDVYLTTAPDEYYKLLRVANFFEHIGWVVENNYIEDPLLIIELFGGVIKQFYPIYEDYFLSVRQTDSKFYEYFDKIYGKTIARFP